MSATQSGEQAQEVQRDGRGRVWVGGRRVADRAGWFSLGIERHLLPVRDRTSDDWWRMAAAIDEAMEPYGTGGPLGPGVDFFADDGGHCVPEDVRREIQADAYDAAREAIIAGIDEHVRRMVPALEAARVSGSSAQEATS